jgi:hypothetical protein
MLEHFVIISDHFAPESTSPSSLPDLIRQSIFPARFSGFLDPRIKSGGDELGAEI